MFKKRLIGRDAPGRDEFFGQQRVTMDTIMWIPMSEKAPEPENWEVISMAVI